MLITIETYALFETNAVTDKEIPVGEWEILVNSTNISTSRTVTINNFNYVNGSHTQSGYFAPGSTAYFDILIDASGTDVSVEYDLSIDDTPIEDYPNIYFSYYNVTTEDEVVDNDYSDIIGINDANRVIRVRVYIHWNNQASYDETDVELIGSSLEFTIDANFRQYIS